MSDPQPDFGDGAKLFARIAILQTVLAVIAVFISVVALYAALTEADSVRKQQAASVWPYVAVYYTINLPSNEGRPFLQVGLSNDGIGPARIEGARITLDGTAYDTWADLFGRLAPDTFSKYRTSAFSRRVIPAGQSVVFLNMADPDEITALAGAFDRLDARICYCSVFDDCWTASLQDRSRPEPVARCDGLEGYTFAE